jgi:hypothetical protein
MGPMTWISGSYHFMIDDLSIIFCELMFSQIRKSERKSTYSRHPHEEAPQIG